MLNSGPHNCLLWKEANLRLADVLGLLPRNQS